MQQAISVGVFLLIARAAALQCPDAVIIETLCPQVQSASDTTFIPFIVDLKLPDSLVERYNGDPKTDPPVPNPGLDSARNAYLSHCKDSLFLAYDLRDPLVPRTRLGPPTETGMAYGPVLARKVDLLSLAKRAFVLALEPDRGKDPLGLQAKPSGTADRPARGSFNAQGQAIDPVKGAKSQILIPR